MLPQSPAEQWHELLKPMLLRMPGLPEDLFRQMRRAKLTFGDRVHWHFLRPCFLSPQDEERVRTVAETIAELGERVVHAALEDKHLFAQLRLREEEERLARIPVGFGPASTASRLDAFLVPDALKFAEYNGESPAGAGYAETLAEIFNELPIMGQFARKYEVHRYSLSAKLLEALLQSYRDWGGPAQKPQIAIVDWKQVPTWSEFEILQARFENMGIPGKRVVADVQTAHYGRHVELLAFIRQQRENLVVKPSDEYGGSGVTLGWETGEAAWDETIERALTAKNGAWIVQERIPVRREVFPYIGRAGRVDYRDMPVGFAPYVL